MLASRIAVILVAALLGGMTVCPAAGPPFVRRDADGDPLPPGAVGRLGTLRLFHPGSVDFKTFTPDDRFLITATYDPDGLGPESGTNLFCVWDLSTGRCVRQFGHSGGIHHAVQSADGRRIVSVGPPGTFVWDVPSGRLIRQLEKKQDLEQPANPSDRTAFRDEKTLVVLRHNHIETLQLADGRRVRGIRLFEESGIIGDPLVLSPDGKRIVMAGGGGEGIRVVDTATGKPQGEIRAGKVWSVTFHPSGKVFAVEHGPKGTVQIHDATTLRMLRRWKLRKGFVCNPLSDGPRCAFAPGGNLLATFGPKGAIDLWDWTTGAFVRKLCESTGDPIGLTFSLDGKLVASGAGIGRIRVFAVSTSKELLPSKGHRTSIQSIRYIDRNTLVSTAVFGGPTLTWDVRTGRVVRSVAAEKYGDVLSPDGKVRARPDPDGTVLLLDSTTGKKQRLLGVSHLRPKYKLFDWVLLRLPPQVAFSPDGSVLAYADPDGPIRLWGVDTGKECGRLGKWNNRRIVKCLNFSPDGGRLAVGGYEDGGMMEVWDTAKRKLLRKVTVPVREDLGKLGGYAGPLGGVEGVTFTPDGRAVAIANPDGPVRLWEIVSGRQLLRSDPKPGKRAACTAVACSPDSRLVASAEPGSSIVLWEVASGREVGRFRPTGGRHVQALAFSPDGKMLASGGEDPTVLLWKIPDSASSPKR